MGRPQKHRRLARANAGAAGVGELTQTHAAFRYELGAGEASWHSRAHRRGGSSIEVLVLIVIGIVVWLVIQANAGKGVLQSDIRELSTEQAVKFLALCVIQRNQMLGRMHMQGAHEHMNALSRRAEELVSSLLGRYGVVFTVIPTATGNHFLVAETPDNAGAFGIMMADVAQFAGPAGFSEIQLYLQPRMNVAN